MMMTTDYHELDNDGEAASAAASIAAGAMTSSATTSRAATALAVVAQPAAVVWSSLGRITVIGGTVSGAVEVLLVQSLDLDMPLLELARHHSAALDLY